MFINRNVMHVSTQHMEIHYIGAHIYGQYAIFFLYLSLSFSLSPFSLSISVEDNLNHLIDVLHNKLQGIGVMQMKTRGDR